MADVAAHGEGAKPERFPKKVPNSYRLFWLPAIVEGLEIRC
jgi:hypothetical protein